MRIGVKCNRGTVVEDAASVCYDFFLLAKTLSLVNPLRGACELGTDPGWNYQSPQMIVAPIQPNAELGWPRVRVSR